MSIAPIWGIAYPRARHRSVLRGLSEGNHVSHGARNAGSDWHHVASQLLPGEQVWILRLVIYVAESLAGDSSLPLIGWGFCFTGS